MSKVFAIGDIHIGHRGILKYREEFASLEDHNQHILNNILVTCDRSDTLWLMGDCFFTWHSLEFARQISMAIGKINLVLGNHCSDNAERQKVIKTLLALGYVDEIHGLGKYKGAWMSHAPIHEDELRRHLCVHGHTHHRIIEKHRIVHSESGVTTSKLLYDPRYICVSCEQVNYTPVELLPLIKARKEELGVGR